MKKSKGTSIELLSPAGSFDSLKAAVNNGCDAVYIGGKNFSARKHAENFDNNELEAAIDYAHLRGVKVYIAVNTLYYDRELEQLAEFCAHVYSIGADAFIVQDIGAAAIIRGMSDINLHASTQLTVRTATDVEFLKDFGFTRFILSREIPLDEIKKINALGVETEVFIHGALCYSHSGQCLMSAFIGKSNEFARSGNRGNCAQPCRLKYSLENGIAKVSEGYLLSPKDMQTLDMLPKIISAGVTSLKIEGRMKSPKYVALATKSYRERIESIDEPTYTKTTLAKAELAQVFSRGGEFCEGYFKSHSSPNMMSVSQKSSGIVIGEVVKYIPQMGTCVISLTSELTGGDGVEIRSTGAYYNSSVQAAAGDIVTISVGCVNNPDDMPQPGDKVYKSFDKRLDDRLKKLASADTRKQLLIGAVEARIGHPLRFSLRNDSIAVTECGAIVERAAKTPLTRERVLEQLAKSGGTPFAVEFGECEIDGGIYIDIKNINDVRRRALAEMEHRIAESYKRPTVTPKIDIVSNVRDFSSKFTVLAHNSEQAIAALAHAPIAQSIYRIYLECTTEIINELERIISNNNTDVRIFAALPACARQNEAELLSKLEASGIDGYLVRTYGQLHKLAAINSKKEIALDYSFNVMNSHSFAQLAEYASSICLSTELDSIDNVRSEAACATESVCYGRLTLMHTNLCPVGISSGKSNGMYCGLRNKQGKYTLLGRNEYAVIRDCESCTARILSPIDKREGCGVYSRIDFTTESPEECEAVLNKYLR